MRGHRRHPVTALALATVPTVLAMAWGPGGGAVALAFVLGGVGFRGRVGSFVKSFVLLLAPFLLLLGLVAVGGLVGGESPRDAARHFGVFSLRLAGVISVVHWLRLEIRLPELRAALASSGLPPRATYVLISPLRLLTDLQARAQLVVDALHARGVPTAGSLRARGSALRSMVPTLLVGTILDAQHRTTALEARGFGFAGSRANTLLVVPRSTRDTALQRLAVGLSFLLIVARLV